MDLLHSRYFAPAIISVLGIVAALGLILAAPTDAGAHESFGAGPHAVGSTLSVTIADSGQALIRGAQVTGVSGNTVSANTKIGNTTLAWSVVTDSTTQFVPKFGTATTSVTSIKVGDYISFSGMIDSAASGLTVDAKVLKDFSIVVTPTPKPKPVSPDNGKKDWHSFLDSIKSRFGFHFGLK